MSRQQQIEDMLRPVIEDLGYEFVGAQHQAHGGTGLLRVYIDKPGLGVMVDDCARASREISTVLDVNDPIPGHYTLEVSSPGIERPLFTPAHFAQFKGQQAKLTVSIPVGGRRKFKGMIRAVQNDQIVLEVDGDEIQLAHDNVLKARLVPEF